jgi:proteasome lid subunit RPN8/RPN11
MPPLTLTDRAPMRIPQALIDDIIAHAREQEPQECCGLIAIDSTNTAQRVYRCGNAAQSTYRYEIDGLEQFGAVELFKTLGLSLGAIFHSHTVGPCWPSGVDVATWRYPDALMIIVGLQEMTPVVRAFRVSDGLSDRVREEPLERF